MTYFLSHKIAPGVTLEMLATEHAQSAINRTIHTHNALKGQVAMARTAMFRIIEHPMTTAAQADEARALLARIIELSASLNAERNPPYSERYQNKHKANS